MPAPTSEQYKRWYDSNQKTQIQRVEARRKRLAKWLREYKALQKCARCPEDHPACLDFHHRDPSQKDVEIGRIIKRGWSIERMMKEIEKCEVLCSNCHRKEHARLQSVSGDAPDL